MAVIPSMNWSIGLAVCLLAQVFVLTSGGAVSAKLGALENEPFAYEQDNGLDALVKDSETSLSEKQEKRPDDKLVRDSETSLSERQEKRGIGTIIIAGSLIVNLGSLSHEIAMKIHGCCGHFPDLCNYRKEIFNVWKPKLENKSREVDNKYTASKNFLEYVKQENDFNREIWEAVKKFKTFTSELVESLHPEIIQALQNKQLELKRAIEAKNKTVMGYTYSQLNSQWKSVFDSAEGTALTLSGILGNGLFVLASYSIKKYRINKIAQTLDTNFGNKLQNAKVQKIFGITDNNIKAHIKQTATSQYNAQLSTSKMTKILNVATGAMALVSAGMDIWRIVNVVLQCKQLHDGAKTSLEDIKKSYTQTVGVLNDVKEYYKNITTHGFDFIKQQITGENITQVFREIVTTAKNAGNQAQKLVDAYKTVENFIAKIGPADVKQTYELQKKLKLALMIAVIPYDCYLSKIRAIQYVIKECKKGDYSMLSLFNSAKSLFPKFNSDSCKNDAGVPYTFFNDINSTVSKMLVDQSYQADCILNNNKTKLRVCSLKNDFGYTEDEIITSEKLTRDQVRYFTTDCPKRLELNNKEKTIICNLKKQSLSLNATAEALDLPDLYSKIKAHYNTCPTLPPTTLPLTTRPPLSNGTIAQICQLKTFWTLKQVIDFYPELPKDQVTAAYNNCP